MLALRKTGPGKGVAFEEIDPPLPGVGEVLIEVATAGICGSDLHVDDWTNSYRFIGPALPVTLGHEFSGTVVGHGADTDRAALPVGSHVVVMPSVTCGACDACRSGNFDACAKRTGIGMTRDGAFACFVAAPARNCLPVPLDLDPGIAALAEPLTVAWQAVTRGSVGPGTKVLVLGPGTIGQAIAVMARRAGAADVVLAGRSDGPRLATARRLGFERVFDIAEAGNERRLSNAAGEGFDVVLEATGAAAAIRLGLELMRPGSTLVATGIHDELTPFDVTRIVRRQLDIRGSYRAPLTAWSRIITTLSENPSAFAPMITRRMSLADGLEAFALGHDRAESKILLIP
jgi:threonine dehydrogenase-like Zn-dependent dehydrogenase